MLPLIDGDIIRYRVGYACEYTVYWNSKTDEPIRGIRAWKEHIANHPEQQTCDMFDRIILDPIENCLHSVKNIIEHTMTRCKSKDCVIYLTGKNNFRDKVATIQKYKGNRPDRKPKHYDAITKYLLDVWDATVVDGIEADDAMAIQQSAYPDTCIVSNDKDLLQIPGWHYDFVKDEFKKIEEFEGLHFLYQQILTGDATDNIQGIPGVGAKTAQKALDWCETEQDLYQVARDMYIEKIGKGWQSVMNETAQLVYMLRHAEDKWSPPNE